MKNRTIALTFALLTLVMGCTDPSDQDQKVGSTELGGESTVIIADNSATSLDWNGTYQGIIPCADCEGIETSLTLNKDKSYVLTTKYLGKNGQTLEQKGTFTWNKEGNTVLLSDIKGGTTQYFVGENMVIQLDMKGNKITGNLVDKYILNKVTDSAMENVQQSLFNTRWKQSELMGKKIATAEDKNQEIFIRLNSNGNKVEGFGGCNNFLGNYEIKEGNRIMFSKMISTRKACPHPLMEIETELLQVLQTADNYNFDGQVLSLNKAKMAPLAKFNLN